MSACDACTVKDQTIASLERRLLFAERIAHAAHVRLYRHQEPIGAVADPSFAAAVRAKVSEARAEGQEAAALEALLSREEGLYPDQVRAALPELGLTSTKQHDMFVATMRRLVRRGYVEFVQASGRWVLTDSGIAAALER